jgi:hypothetical protein
MAMEIFLDKFKSLNGTDLVSYRNLDGSGSVIVFGASMS